jgi:putative endonuclease
MSYRVYILQSKTTGRYYCGHTDDLDRRLRQHNDPDYHGSKTTKRFEGPWAVFWSQQVESRSKAMMLERKIKKRGMQRFLQNMQSIEVPPAMHNYPGRNPDTIRLEFIHE